MGPSPDENEIDEVESDINYDFPKVELHCHLDGCYRVQTIAELARKRGVSLPSYDPEELLKHITTSEVCASLHEYLDKIANAIPSFAGDADAISRIVKEAVEDKALDGVVYVELRYCPQYFANCDVQPMLHAKEKGRMRPKDVVAIVNEAVKESEMEFGVKVRTILCDITLHPWGEEITQLCREYASQGVVAIDIAGPEDMDDFSRESQEHYKYCKMNSIHRTAHAGEVGPGKRVRNAVEHLHAERIGHGYHVVDDEEGYAMAKERRMHFEVCPLSSRYTSAVKGHWSNHPVVRFYEDGIDFGLSSDDPGVNRSGLLGDYDIATSEWGFTVKDLQKLNLNAARACFLDGAEKQQLISDLKREYADYNRNIDLKIDTQSEIG